MKKLAALIAFAGLASGAAAQHTRNALVYAARAVGDTTWNYGAFAINNTTDTAPITFEVAVFADWKTGYGFIAATYKSYIDCNNATDSIAIIDDTNSFNYPVSPNDGRQGYFDYTAATQKVMSTRHPSLGGSGFRVTGSPDNAADASPGGAMYFNQRYPTGSPFFDNSDHVLGYRFNVTLAHTGGDPRTAHVWTPLSRVGGFSTYNSMGGATTTDFKTSLILESLDLTAKWVPAPSTLALLGIGGLLSTRRRR